MNKLNLSIEVKKLILLFISWRLSLLLIMVLAIKFIPLSQKDKYLGGGPFNFPLSPGLFSWANFDGEHYLSIAQNGYKILEQAFFPMYPMMMSVFARPFSGDKFSQENKDDFPSGLICYRREMVFPNPPLKSNPSDLEPLKL